MLVRTHWGHLTVLTHLEKRTAQTPLVVCVRKLTNSSLGIGPLVDLNLYHLANILLEKNQYSEHVFGGELYLYSELGRLGILKLS